MQIDERHDKELGKFKKENEAEVHEVIIENDRYEYE